MKKNLLLTAVLLSSGASIFAYTHTIFNTTRGKVRVNLSEPWCKDDDVTVNPGESKEVGVAGCLVSSVTARGLSAPISGMRAEVDTDGNQARSREWFINFRNGKLTIDQE